MSRFSKLVEDMGNPVTLALGITTTISYGTLFYIFSVFAPVLSSEFGITLETFFAIFAAALLLAGFFAPVIGGLLDRQGAQRIMVIGSAIAGISLILLSLSNGLWSFAIAVLIIELAASMVFYEAAFTGLTQIYGQNARRRITAITLIAGFSSTLFWPLTQFLVNYIGWRDTCIAFAALNVMVNMPLHWYALRHASKSSLTAAVNSKPTASENILTGKQRRHAIIFYTISTSLAGMVFASIPVHLLIILQGQGISAQSAALMAMAMGPSQVLARVVEMASEDRHSSVFTGRLSMAVLPLAMLALLLPVNATWLAVVFVVFYGVSQGLSNIVRGTVPLQLFGSLGYGTLMGRMTGIRYVLNAAAPFLLAILITRFGISAALWSCLALGLASALTFWQIRAPTIHSSSRHAADAEKADTGASNN